MTAQELAVKQKQEVSDQDELRQGRYFQPYVDITEDEHALRIHADVPGADPNHVNVELHDGVLTIQAEVGLDEYKDLAPTYSEYNVGHYRRRFRLADRSHYDADKVAARLENGVLAVELPKAEAVKPRRIPVAAV